jgi:phosphohistidine phosphatase SixA
MGTMKKELFIVRHAKSSWDLENISDIDRPLSLRGIRNAYEMARHLKIERNIPELFISSPANRALHTATIFLNVFELLFDKLKIDNRLYGLGVHDILTFNCANWTQIGKETLSSEIMDSPKKE